MRDESENTRAGAADVDTSLDVAGVGKLAKAIPPKAWEKIVSTACDTFAQCIAPVTSTTAGCGRLIQARFDRLVEIEKLYAAECMAKAREKVKKSKRTPKETPKAPIILKAIEESATQTDENMRELWANLIAQELIDGNVHPEFPRILSRLSAADAQTLAEVMEASPKTFNQKEFRVFIDTIHKFKLPLIGVTVGGMIGDAKSTFSTAQLQGLNLIERSGGIWILTVVGEEFIKAVSDPTQE